MRKPGPGEPSTLVTLDSEQAHHANRVLRLRDDELVETFDGRGLVGVGRFRHGGKVRVERFQHIARPVPAVELAVALPKGPRADQLVNMVSQLGADQLIPLRTARSVVHPRAGRLQRFEKQAIESARQCGRAHVMGIGPLTPINTLLARARGRCLLAHADAPVASSVNFPEATRVLILIGPEGGWTEDELGLADRNGCVLWRLGPNVMRIETAAAAAVAIARWRGTCSL